MLAGFASNPWDYALSPKPRTGGTVGKPFVNPAVSNLLQAPEPVPMGQAWSLPGQPTGIGVGGDTGDPLVMVNGQMPRPNTKPAVVPAASGIRPWPQNSGMSDTGPTGSLESLIQQLLATMNGGTDPVTQTQKPYGSPPWMSPSNPVTKPLIPHGLVSNSEPVLKPYFGGMMMTPEMMQRNGYRSPTTDEMNAFIAQSGGNVPA